MTACSWATVMKGAWPPFFTTIFFLEAVAKGAQTLEFPTKSGPGVKLYSARSYSAGDTYPNEECRRLVL